MIKQDLAKLNMDIADLQQQVKSRSHHETKHMKTHSSSVVVSLQVSSLKSFSSDVIITFEVMKKKPSHRVGIQGGDSLYGDLCK